MYNRKLAIEIVDQIHHSLETILKRFEPISKAEDFYHTEEGLEKLDAICMQLIAVGESLKNLDKVSGSSILSEYQQIDWKGAKGMRDIITHHYFNLDAETVFFVCQEKIPPMKACMEQIAADLINGTV